jgi:hypothetical protein
MDRRGFIATLAGAIAYLTGCARPKAKTELEGEGYLSSDELAVLSAASERIIPTTERSGGAIAAGVPEFIDRYLNLAPVHIANLWREDLRRLDSRSRSQLGKPFAALSALDADSLLRSMSGNERAPSTPDERFFSRLKPMVIHAYYTSKVGIFEELRYQGNHPITEFVGCESA